MHMIRKGRSKIFSFRLKSKATMKYLKLLVLAILLMAFQCDEDIKIIDPLVETGILGRWEIADETVNGISDLLPKCCRFLEFSPDDNLEDLIGNFIYTDELQEDIEWTFIIDPVDGLIIFKRQGRDDLVYDYEINDAQDYLTFTFSEGNAVHVEGWRRTN